MKQRISRKEQRERYGSRMSKAEFKFLSELPNITVKVSEIPACDFCAGYCVVTDALYDGLTRLGPWFYMCQKHFDKYGTGLGLGKGQKLILKGKKI